MLCDSCFLLRAFSPSQWHHPLCLLSGPECLLFVQSGCWNSSEAEVPASGEPGLPSGKAPKQKLPVPGAPEVECSAQCDIGDVRSRLHASEVKSLGPSLEVEAVETQ